MRFSNAVFSNNDIDSFRELQIQSFKYGKACQPKICNRDFEISLFLNDASEHEAEISPSEGFSRSRPACDSAGGKNAKLLTAQDFCCFELRY